MREGRLSPREPRATSTGPDRQPGYPDVLVDWIAEVTREPDRAH